MIYYADKDFLIRSMEIDDARIFYETYLSYGWHPSLEVYENYYKEQEENKRKVFVAVYKGAVCGLCTLVMNPTEGPWVGKGYPEIVDLSVFNHVHNKGIGNKLLDVIEREAAKVSDTVFLAVGLHSGYGAAQRIYVKRGYIPDGNGVWYQGKPLEQYVPCCNDDDLLLFMSKKLLTLTLRNGLECTYREEKKPLMTVNEVSKLTGVNKMDFEAFDTTKMDEYARRAKEQWGQTSEYKESEEKAENQSADTQKKAWQNLMLIFAEFGKMKDKKPEHNEVQMEVKKLQDYISEHFYKCSNEVLKGLGAMYVSDGEFTENIDKAGGSGTAVFVAKAIEIYCG